MLKQILFTKIIPYSVRVTAIDYALEILFSSKSKNKKIDRNTRYIKVIYLHIQRK